MRKQIIKKRRIKIRIKIKKNNTFLPNTKPILSLKNHFFNQSYKHIHDLKFYNKNYKKYI